MKATCGQGGGGRVPEHHCSTTSHCSKACGEGICLRPAQTIFIQTRKCEMRKAILKNMHLGLISEVFGWILRFSQAARRFVSHSIYDPACGTDRLFPQTPAHASLGKLSLNTKRVQSTVVFDTTVYRRWRFSAYSASSLNLRLLPDLRVDGLSSLAVGADSSHAFPRRLAEDGAALRHFGK
jgi:hypothetical protein